MKISALFGDRIAVRPAVDTGVYGEGILLKPAAFEEDQYFGVVEHTGLMVTAPKVGETVLYSKFAAIPIDITGETLMILRVEDVIATLHPDA